MIESVSFSGGPSATIKSHHNVGGLPERMHLKLVEPLRELFKDEVRALGRELGLPDRFVGRHPFPGPGLAIRCPGAITREKLAILRQADAVYLDQIRKHGLYDAIWQAFTVLLPVRSVGVMGDGRTYDYVCALRAVTSVDGMTADYYPFDHAFLGETATRIINEVKGSTASLTTSPRSRRARSSGSERDARAVLRRSANVRTQMAAAEKKIARRAFENALDAALAKIMAEFKAKAAAAAEPSDMWDVEDYLRRKRGEIDETFDYRYSQLPWVFAVLIRQGRLDEAQLSGLSDDKLETIRRVLSR